MSIRPKFWVRIGYKSSSWTLTVILPLSRYLKMAVYKWSGWQFHHIALIRNCFNFTLLYHNLSSHFYSTSNCLGQLSSRLRRPGSSSRRMSSGLQFLFPWNRQLNELANQRLSGYILIESGSRFILTVYKWLIIGTAQVGRMCLLALFNVFAI